MDQLNIATCHVIDFLFFKKNIFLNKKKKKKKKKLVGVLPTPKPQLSQGGGRNMQ
jgi:hypothetical protein